MKKQNDSPAVGSKRSRHNENRERSKKNPKQLPRYFQQEPSEQQFQEITKNLSVRLLVNDPPQNFPSYSLKEEILALCEDLQSLANSNPTKWNKPTIDWCLKLLCPTVDSKTPIKESIKLQINEQTQKNYLSPVVLLLTDSLYNLNYVSKNNLEKLLSNIIEQCLQSERTLWLVGWLGFHFPKFAIATLLKQLVSNIPTPLPEIDALQTTVEEIEKLGAALRVTKISLVLEYLCDKSPSYFAHYLQVLLVSKQFTAFFAILMFLPSSAKRCSRIIINTFKKQLNELSKSTDQLNQVLECLIMRISSFHVEVLPFVRCMMSLPEPALIKYNKFLSDILELIHSNNTEIVAAKSFQKHVKHVRSAIIPLCTIAVDEKTMENQRITALSYLQIISMVTDEAAALEIVFRLFLCESDSALPVLMQLLDQIKENYKGVQNRFIQRLMTFLSNSSNKELSRGLSKLLFISRYENDSQNVKGDSMVQCLGEQSYFEVFASFLEHNECEVRILSFKIIRLIIPCVQDDPITVFLLVQKLISCLFIHMEQRTESLLDAFPSEVDNYSVINSSWMIQHIKSLIKELSQTEMISLQIIDLLLDISFSERSDGIIRESISGSIPPANYLLQPDPIMLNFSFHSSHQKKKNVPRDSMLEYNKTRRLFGKDMQQDKVIPPPVAPSTTEHERKKLEKFCWTENQQIILDIVDSLLKQSPASYVRFTDILLTRVTSSYPVPSDEQYLEILPRRSNYDFDVFIRKIFIQNPIFIGYLSILAENPVEFMKCFVVVKSLLANMIGDWNIVTNSGNDPVHVAVTIELLKTLKKAAWFPSRLQNCHEILPLVSSAEGTQILMSLWRFIRENVPKRSEFIDSESDKVKSERDLEYKRYRKHLHVISQVLHRNINNVAPFYSSFFTPLDTDVEMENK